MAHQKTRPGSVRTAHGRTEEEDVKGFRNFLRMDYEIYQEILTRIEHRINPKKSMYRKPLTAGIKLAITSRYLASGDSYHSLMYGFRVAHNTISKVIRQVCDAIVAEFAEEVIPCPQTPKEWKNIANQFRDRWQLHNCVGALDGKHIAIQCPPRGGSLCYNYKGYHSIILMALVDAEYKFIWAEVGAMDQPVMLIRVRDSRPSLSVSTHHDAAVSRDSDVHCPVLHLLTQSSETAQQKCTCECR